MIFRHKREREILVDIWIKTDGLQRTLMPSFQFCSISNYSPLDPEKGVLFDFN